jgi:hypothetical protein
MEKEFIIDQEDVVVIAADDIKKENIEPNADYSDFSEEDFTVADENNFDWSAL